MSNGVTFIRKIDIDNLSIGICVSSTNTARIIKRNSVSYTSRSSGMCHIKGVFMYVDEEGDVIFNNTLTPSYRYEFILMSSGK